MCNQKLIPQGFGVLRLSLGFVIFFVISIQARSIDFDTMRLSCPDSIPTYCEHGNYTIEENGCTQYVCTRYLRERCDEDALYPQCMPNTSCKCGYCQGCVGLSNGQWKDCYSDLNLCKKDVKRLSNRLPPWYHRARWPNLSPKYLESKYYEIL